MLTIINDKPQKLSKTCLKQVGGLSYSVFMKLLRKKDVKINGVRVNKDILLNVGDKIEIYYSPSTVTAYKTIYSDDNVVVVDKQSGFTSDEIYSKILIEHPTARFIHRLDRNTCGLMIFALNTSAEEQLLYGFKHHAFDKKYLCTVYGKVKKDSDILSAYLLKDASSSTVKIFDKKVDGSVEIKTGYRVISRKENTTDLEVTLYTGKTHQIRAHLSFIGHFILGDGKYGDAKINKQFGLSRQQLKAYKLTLRFGEDSSLYYLNGKTFEI